MDLIRELRYRHGNLWDSVVNHRFVLEMGDGSLGKDQFKRYLIQDYMFIKDLVILIALGIAKANDLYYSTILNRFLTGILNPENDYFERSFTKLNVQKEEYETSSISPTMQAFGDFLVRIAHEGQFEDIMMALYVTEGTYLDWGTNLANNMDSNVDPIYKEWIELHSPSALGEIVHEIGDYLKNLDHSVSQARLEDIFVTTLNYEYMFWESSHKS